MPNWRAVCQWCLEFPGQVVSGVERMVAKGEEKLGFMMREVASLMTPELHAEFAAKHATGLSGKQWRETLAEMVKRQWVDWQWCEENTFVHPDHRMFFACCWGWVWCVCICGLLWWSLSMGGLPR